APVRMIQIAPGDVVAQRGLTGGVETDRDLELLDRAPERLELRVVDVAAVHRVGVADHGDGAQLTHRAPGLADGQLGVVERDLRGELQAVGVVRAGVAGPVVGGAGRR